VDVKDGAEVVMGVVSALIVGEQGRVFEGENGEAGHEGIGQGDGMFSGAVVREGVETRSQTASQGIGGQIFTALLGGRGHDRQVLSPGW
jgi:hypothetical protein